MAGGPAAGNGDGLAHASLAWSLIMSAFAAIGGILFGYDTGTIGGCITMRDWIETFGTYDSTGVLGTDTGGYFLKTADKSLVVSILSAGTFFGALSASAMADLVGRKWGIVASCAIFSLGVGLQLDTSWAAFIVGRVIAGFGVGLTSTIVPMYQSETSPKNLRGLIVGLYQLAITIGALIAAIVLNATKNHPDHSAWRIPIAVQFVWAFILGGGMILLPESPRYLLYKGRVDAARKALARLTNAPIDSEIVAAETQEIQLALKAEVETSKATWMDCFKADKLKTGLRTWTGIFLQAWQQLTGINFIMYYGTSFFQNSGIKCQLLRHYHRAECGQHRNDDSWRVLLDFHVNLNLTPIGVQLIDRVGRRRLLLIGAAGMVLCEFIVAIVGVTRGQIAADGSVNLSAQRVLIAFTAFYIAFFATSWGPVVWVLTGELFALNVRAKSMALAVASNWLWNFGIGYATPYLVDQSTAGQPNGVATASLGVKVFFIWGSTCLGSGIFTYFFVPETKGLSLEQIDLLYQNSSILGSTKYGRELLMAGGTHTLKAEQGGETKHLEDTSLEKSESATPQNGNGDGAEQQV
ncbi:Monosaccharide importer [Mycena kentingensis (nom. inval.)]|nr:Monosaccharide importer [Mycena kentingensis (nom. inval.)]